MFDFRLKHAQVAIKDGRLEEAYNILEDSKLREQRMGQSLINTLGEAYLKRCISHLDSGRLDRALGDCNRAEKLAGNTPEIGDLKLKIHAMIEQKSAIKVLKEHKIAVAKAQLDRGWHEDGGRVLAGTQGLDAEMMLKKANLNAEVTATTMSKIDKALNSGQVLIAAELFCKGIPQNTNNLDSIDLLSRIHEAVSKKLFELLSNGKINEASSFMSELKLDCYNSEKFQSAMHALKLCEKASGLIQDHQYEKAILNLKKCTSLIGKCKWIVDSVNQLTLIVNAEQELLCGPLGLVDSVYGSMQLESFERPLVSEEVKIKHDIMNQGLVKKFMLQIDGVGAYLVNCNNRVTIGSAGSKKPDVAVVLPADSDVREIERIEEDYFISSKGNCLNKNLLNDQDKIEISHRCRFKFSVPNPASSTACLIPVSARLPRSDIKSVILMSREILIGSRMNNHILVSGQDETITLYQKDDGIYVRSNEPVYVNEKRLDRGLKLPFGNQIRIGQISIVLRDL